MASNLPLEAGPLTRQTGWLARYQPGLRLTERGYGLSVGDDMAWIHGLPSAAQQAHLSKVLQIQAERLLAVRDNYAAYTALHQATKEQSANIALLEPFARNWELQTREVFLASYVEAIQGCPVYPQDSHNAQVTTTVTSSRRYAPTGLTVASPLSPTDAVSAWLPQGKARC